MNSSYRLIRSPAARLQGGAALIIAIIILALLLIMAVPFLQSMLLSSTDARRSALRQISSTYQDSAIDLGLSLLAYANENQQGTNVFSLRRGLEWYADDFTLTNDGAILLDVAEIFSGTAQTYRAGNGITLRDTGGQLDVNALNTAAWHAVLTNVLGSDADWDDNQVDDTDIRNAAATPVADTADDDDSDFQNQDDGDEWGQLAEALANGRPYSSLTDLLDVTTPGAAPNNLRDPLTPQELAQLAPYLGVHPSHPGRSLRDSAGNNAWAGHLRPLDHGSIIMIDENQDPDVTNKFRALADYQQPAERHRDSKTRTIGGSLSADEPLNLSSSSGALSSGSRSFRNNPQWDQNDFALAADAPRTLNPFALSPQQANRLAQLAIIPNADALKWATAAYHDTLPSEFGWHAAELADWLRAAARPAALNNGWQDFALSLQPQQTYVELEAGSWLTQRDGRDRTTLSDYFTAHDRILAQPGFGGNSFMSTVWDDQSRWYELWAQGWTSHLAPGPDASWRDRSGSTKPSAPSQPVDNEPNDRSREDDHLLTSQPLPGINPLQTIRADNPIDYLRGRDAELRIGDNTTIDTHGISSDWSMQLSTTNADSALNAFSWESWVTPTEDFALGSGAPIQVFWQTRAQNPDGLTNELILWFDPRQNEIVLTILPSSIAHSDGPGINAATHLPSNETVDPASYTGADTKFSRDAMTRRWQRIEHRYSLGADPFFLRNRAVHLHLIIAEWQPGGIALAVNHHWGQDVGGRSDLIGSTPLFGWYESLPSVFLGNPAFNPSDAPPITALAENDPEWFADHLSKLDNVFADLSETDRAAFADDEDTWDRWRAFMQANTGWRALQTSRGSGTEATATAGTVGELTVHHGPLSYALQLSESASTAADYFLPAAGMITIGKEVLAYDGIAETAPGINTLSNVLRGQRQDTDLTYGLVTDDAGNPVFDSDGNPQEGYRHAIRRSPQLFQHWQGDRILPGGLTARLEGSIYHGTGELRDPWPTATDGSAILQATVVQINDESGAVWTNDDDTPYTAGTTSWPNISATNTLILDDSADLPKFPANGGIIKLIANNSPTTNGMVLRYGQYDENLRTFSDIEQLSNDDVEGATYAMATELAKDQNASIVLVGIAVAITQGTRDDWPGFPASDNLFAIRNGFGEFWSRYNGRFWQDANASGADDPGDVLFLMHNAGWGDARGVDRTDGQLLASTNDAVFPVQINVPNGHLFHSGETLNFVRQEGNPDEAIGPLQVFLRIRDHWDNDPNAPHNATHDAHNHYFTLVSPPDITTPLGALDGYEMHIGMGWGPAADSSPKFLDASYTGSAAATLQSSIPPKPQLLNETALVMHDDATPQNPVLEGGLTTAWAAVVYDDFHAQTTDHALRFAALQDVSPTDENPTVNGIAGGGDDVVFARIDNETVLMRENGEVLVRQVFASPAASWNAGQTLRQWVPRVDLLGMKIDAADSTEQKHWRFTGNSTIAITVNDSDQTITPTFRGFVALEGQIEDANAQQPYYLIIQPDQSSSRDHSYEIIAARPHTLLSKTDGPSSNSVHGLLIAPWMRGLYNTQPISSITSDAIIMPWRPRFAPLLPNNWENDPYREQISRCRHFQWASFPLGGIDLTLENINLWTDSASSTINWQPLLRYARYDLQWWDESGESATASLPTTVNGSGYSSWQRSTNSEVWTNNGCEIRLWPTYEDSRTSSDSSSWLNEVMLRSTTPIGISRMELNYDQPMRILRRD